MPRFSSEFDHIGPFDPYSYTMDVPLGGNDPTVPFAKIYDTPGNTPLNRALGGLVELPGKYKYNGNAFADTWFGGSETYVP